MYKTEPYNAQSRINIDLPTNMYVLDQLYETHYKNCDSKMNYSQLEESQHNLLVRMENLKQQISMMNKNIEKSQCNSASKNCVSDIVISFHPSHVPTPILAAVRILSEIHRVHVQCLLHSSLRSKFQVPQQLQAIHSSLCHNRSKNEFVVTYILKDIETPTMNWNASLPYSIKGISTITKYIFNLAHQNKDHQTNEDGVISQTLVDKWIELTNDKNARDELIMKAKERLSKNSWLVGNDCSAADLIVHSAIGAKGIHQLGPVCNNWIHGCSLTAV